MSKTGSLKIHPEKITFVKRPCQSRSKVPSTSPYFREKHSRKHSRKKTHEKKHSRKKRAEKFGSSSTRARPKSKFSGSSSARARASKKFSGSSSTRARANLQKAGSRSTRLGDPRASSRVEPIRAANFEPWLCVRFGIFSKYYSQPPCIMYQKQTNYNL